MTKVSCSRLMKQTRLFGFGFNRLVLYFTLTIFLVDASYKCKKENEIPVQKPLLQPESNGCSKPEMIQVQGEEDFTYCCDRHDTCYATCGMNKSFCDKDFEKCMMKLCDTNFSRNKDCKSAAQMYAMGTMMFGNQGFQESQQRHCMCITSNKAKSAKDVSTNRNDPLNELESHYVELIDDFYKKYSADTLQEKTPKDIVMTYSREKKTSLPRLYYELHKKYDTAIKHIENRIGLNIVRPPEVKRRGKIKVEPEISTHQTQEKTEL